MPAVYDSLMHHFGYTPGVAWRITLIVPLVCLICSGLGMLLLCDDTPMGKWDQRHAHVKENLESHGLSGALVNVTGTIAGPLPIDGVTPEASSDVEKKSIRSHSADPATPHSPSSENIQTLEHEGALSRVEAVETAQGEIIMAPTTREAIAVIFSLHGLFHVATYALSFGGELAVNSILGAYYLKNFKHLGIGQTSAGNYAAIFGFLNFITRPLGGVVGDLLYNGFGRSLWLKKIWIHVCGILTGVFLIVIGVMDPHDISTMIGLVSLMAVFHEAGNGANFALVPHVYPFANGILSGLTGAGGNLGGVIFAIIFRFMDDGTNYAKGFWIIGVVHIAVNLAVCWIPPIPKGQIGGR